MQGLVPCPALWVDQDDAIAGAASLRVAYRFGGDLQARQLPFRPIKLQPVRKGAQNNELVAYRSYIPAKIHLQLFRLTRVLFPALEQWHADLSSGVVTLLEHGNAGFNEIRAVCLEEVRRHNVNENIIAVVCVLYPFLVEPHPANKYQCHSGYSARVPLMPKHHDSSSQNRH